VPKRLFATCRFVCGHPLSRRAPLRAIFRLLRWQIGSRLALGAIAVRFVGPTRLLVQRGMTGATGNIYCGLHEFEDMGFILHVLRPGDLFVDVGANIGSYTVLAAGVCGARVIAIEPVPATFSSLMDNIRLNDLLGLVTPRNIGIGSRARNLKFSTNLDTVNHVLSDGEASTLPHLEVPTDTLDALLSNEAPIVIKIDTEGFESEVLAGAERILHLPTTLAVLIEFNGSGARYGIDESVLHRKILAAGYHPYRYDPLSRTLTVASQSSTIPGNTLYLRGESVIRARLQSASPQQVLGSSV
jgi:FkbM family methyltransferase